MTNEEPMLSPQEIMDREFTGALRGFDVDQVRAFLRDVAKAHEELLARIGQLESETEALREEVRSRDEELRIHAGGDDDPLIERMRQATSSVLVAAKDAAADIRNGAEGEAERMLIAAREEAASVVAEAHRASAEAREAALHDARQRAAELLEEAHHERDHIRSEIELLSARHEELAGSLERVLTGARDLAKELSVPEVD